jgi:glutamate-5-semialdehyde dehydrogenase
LVEQEVISKAAKAKEAARAMGGLSTTIKDQALLVMAEELVDRADEIIEANKMDMVSWTGCS